MNKGISKREKKQESRELENQCWEYKKPFLEELHQRVDRRLVKTLLDLVMVILMHRHRSHGLILSELGDHLLGGRRGPAGVKRIANLLHSGKWKSHLNLKYLWKCAHEKVQELVRQKEPAYVIWDESVLEKPESLQAEGLCAVRSTKAVRLKRIKPGYFNPPSGRPIFVPGFHWLQLLVTGLKGAPVLAHLCWWTTRGEKASQKREREGKILRKVVNLWGKKVIHVWDRGFAGNPRLTQAFLHGARFVLRWPKNYYVLDEQEQLRQPGQLSKGKHSWEHRLLWDARRRCQRQTGVIAFPIADPTHHQPLWLAVARRKGQSP